MSATIDDWADFWATAFDARRQAGRIETCARVPLDSWLTLDVGAVLDSEVDLTFAELRQRPDAVFATARTAFERFVAGEPDCPGPAASGYDDLAVHLIGLPATAPEETLTDPVAAAGRLVVIESVSPDSVAVGHRAIQVTYRCPAGHETTVDQPLYRYRSINRCGAEDCQNDVFVDDERTRSRRVVEASIDHRGSTLECLGIGRVAADPDRLTADRVRLIGIPRRRTREDGSIDAVVEINNVERMH